MSEPIWQGVVKDTLLGERTKKMKYSNLAIGVLEDHPDIRNYCKDHKEPLIVIGNFAKTTDLVEWERYHNLDELVDLMPNNIILDVKAATRLQKALGAAIQAATDYSPPLSDVEEYDEELCSGCLLSETACECEECEECGQVESFCCCDYCDDCGLDSLDCMCDCD